MGTGGGVVRYVTVEDEGEDEGGGTISDDEGVGIIWDGPDGHVVQMGDG